MQRSPGISSFWLLAIAFLLAPAPPAQAWPPPAPSTSQLFLAVEETAGIARAGEVLTSGMPLLRAWNLTSTANMAVVDGVGNAVPAEFRILARWHADLEDGGAPIQWLQVSFAASAGANATSQYRLVVDGSVANPGPAQPLQISQVGDLKVVNTGAATFVVGPYSLFHEVRSSAGTLLASAGTLVARVSATDTGPGELQGVEVVWAGPLTAVLRVDGIYSLPAAGNLESQRRYVFHAGSPTALVRHSLAWPGSRCGLGELTCANGLNALLMESWRDRLTMNLAAPRTVQIVGDRELAMLSGTVPSGQNASLRQRLRASRTAPELFETVISGVTTSGGGADGGMFSVANANGAIAAGLRAMDRYEPQALRLIADGTLSIDLADGTAAWLGARQGLFANLAVSAFTAAPTRAQLDRELWARLNRPLRAWPSAAWWASSQAVEEVPVGALPADLAAYDTKVPAVLARTVELSADRGLHGLATHGLFPRYWGDPLLSDEIDCGTDLTPADDWDDLYWCTTWADYHNAAATAPIWAFRSGQVEWLDEISAPAAWRMLHTVIQQCGLIDTFFYCGQAPTGYLGYRSDNNGSHAYFDNLFLHYWLTGDETVVRTLRRGANTMRAYFCPGRGDNPPGPMCAPTAPLTDAWIPLNGRAGSQWYRTFRFLGLASGDGTYLEDWRGNVARWLTQYWAQPGTGTGSRGFTVPAGGGSFDFIDGPGTYGSDQLWMASLYDLDVIERLAVDSLDAPLGSPTLAPSAAEIAWARTLTQVGSATPWSTGTPAGPWPNVVAFTFSGPRVGGTLTALGANHIDADGDNTPCELCDDDGDADPQTCADVCLYDSGKAALSGILARAGDRAGDPALRALGRSFAVFGLGALGNNPQPLNKGMGIILSRLHAAVARAADNSASEVFANGFESGNTGAWSAAVP